MSWVISTGNQDHHWPGNDYFAGQGAEVMAMTCTAVTSPKRDARRETSGYYDFLIETIATAATEVEPMDETLDSYTDLPPFKHLENYDSPHRVNMNHIFLEFEAAQ